MYTAEITDKKLAGNALRVWVKFSNGENEVTEIFEVRNGQWEGWLNRTIWKRLEDLNDISTLMDEIPLGPYTATEPARETPERLQYQNKLEKFYRYRKMIEVGVITEADSTYTGLKNWLKNNFQESYNNLF